MEKPKRKTVKRSPQNPRKLSNPKPGFFGRFADGVKQAVDYIRQGSQSGGRFFYYRLFEVIAFWVLAVYFCSLLIAAEMTKLFDNAKQSVADSTYSEKPHHAKKTRHKSRRVFSGNKKGLRKNHASL
jgi:hypothetical protein